MPNSLRSRISKLVYQGKLSKKDAERIRDALEKQIPKKPINPIDEDGYTVFWNCPNCNIQSTDVDVLYCPICGQKIDWSDNE